MNEMDSKWQTTSDIIRNQDIKIAQLRAQVLDDSETSSDDLPIEQISKNQIPAEYMWRYWKDINDLDDYWVGRYMKIIPMESKINRLAIILCLKMGIMYGNTGYDAKNDKAYYLFRDGNELKGYEIVDLLKYENRPSTYTDKDNKIKWNLQPSFKSEQPVTLDKSNIVPFNWRIGGIGDYIWYLQDLMEYLYIKQILVSNTIGLITPYFLHGNNVVAMKKLAKELMNPLKPVKAKIRDTGNIEQTSSNLLGEDVDWASIQLGKSNQQDILLTLKYIQEQAYNKWGIPITSSKNQTLSADANLSISTAETARHVHDELVLYFLNQIFRKKGEETLTFDIFTDVENMIPQGKRDVSFTGGQLGNDNADKKGDGLANTTGGNLIK